MALDVPLAVRLWSYEPGTGTPTTQQFIDRHVTRELRDLSFRASIPGGFQSASFSLDRPLIHPGLDLAPYNGVVIYDTRSAEVVWEGVLEDPGKGVSSDGVTWHMSATGTAGHAGDQVQPVIYIDRRLDEPWQQAQSQVSGWTVNTEARESDDAGTITFRWPRGTGLPAGPKSISIQYRGILDSGQHLALIGGSFDCGRTDGSGDRLFEVTARMGGGSYAVVDSHTWTTTETIFNASVTSEWSGDRDNLRLRITWTNGDVTAVTSDVEWVQVLGLYVRATNYLRDGTESQGPYGNAFVRADLVVADLLGRVLNRYDGANATITANTFQVNQLIYPDGASASQILDDMMLFQPDFFWAAWETNPRTGLYRFEWSPWPTTIGLEADVEDGFDSQSGSAEVYNKVLVRYKDFMGRSKTVTRTQSITDLDRAGVTRSPAPVDLADEMGSPENAAQVADLFLLEHATPPNAGTLTIARPIQDLATGRKLDPWQLPLHAPGKLMRVRGVMPRADALNTTTRDSVTVFKVIAAEYNASSNTASLELDSNPKTVAQLMARYENRRFRKR